MLHYEAVPAGVARQPKAAEEIKPGAASSGQGEADRGAAGDGIVAGVDRAPVGPDQVAGDGQPQAAAPGVTRPGESLEHLA